MTTNNKTRRTKAAKEKRHKRELEGGAGGAIAGAAVGAIAGPPGAAAGAVLGAVAGAFAGAAVEDADEAREARDRQLDEEVGVIGGEMGAPGLKHPPAKVGAYSSASAGAGSSDGGSPAEGPMQPPE